MTSGITSILFSALTSDWRGNSQNMRSQTGQCMERSSRKNNIYNQFWNFQFKIWLCMYILNLAIKEAVSSVSVRSRGVVVCEELFGTARTRRGQTRPIQQGRNYVLEAFAQTTMMLKLWNTSADLVVGVHEVALASIALTFDDTTLRADLRKVSAYAFNVSQLHIHLQSEG